MREGEKQHAATLDNGERAYAKWWHDRQNGTVRWLRTAAIDTANAVIRTLLLLNGSAAIELVSFVAAMVSRANMFELQESIPMPDPPIFQCRP